MMKIAINCKTENEAEALLSFLYSKGFTWRSGDNLKHNSYWQCYKSNTCYHLSYYEFDKIVTFCSVEEHRINEWTDAIPVNDFMDNYQKYTKGFFGS